MSQRAFFLAILGTATTLFAQMPPPEGGHRPFGPPRGGGRLFISPMGEPFRDAPDNAAVWFAEANTHHDGRLTLAEFRSDAMRFFATLDTDHDQEIGPEEIEHYEQEVAPEAGSGGGGFGDMGRPSGGKGGGPKGGRGGHGGGRSGIGGGGMGGGPGGGGMDGHASGATDADGGDAGSASHGPAFDPTQQGAARFSYLALPEPVIAADTDFNRGVSQQEFLAAATRRFALLDTNHDGVITPDELPKLGGAMRPPRGQHGHRPPPTAEE